jgi:hypothetical protein
VSPTVPLAHQTWFDDGAYPTDWGFAVEPLTLALLGTALAITLAARVIARFHPGVNVAFLGRLAPWMPFAVRMHLAVSLVALLSLGFYLSPAMDLEWNVAGVLLGTVMAVAAIGMATGWHARAAAALLVAAGPLGMLEFGFWAVAQRVDLLGLAVFVLLAGPGRWSADHESGRAEEMSFERAAQAVWALRIAAGVGLIVVAFVEKLATPEFAVAFLADRPEFNIAQQVGIPLSDLDFIRIAGGIEVLFGLLLISGALPQAAVLIAGVPFNLTLLVFGINELAGHLPIYGAMLVLLVFGSDPELRDATRDFWPFGRARSRHAQPRTASGRSASGVPA